MAQRHAAEQADLADYEMMMGQADLANDEMMFEQATPSSSGEMSEADRLGLEAQTLASQGQLEAALTKLNQALEIEEDNIVALRTRGDLLETVGRPEDAIQDYDRVLELDATDVLAWNNRGYTFLKMGGSTTRPSALTSDRAGSQCRKLLRKSRHCSCSGSAPRARNR